MAFFTAGQQALAAGERVGHTRLVLFDFEGAPMRVWEGGAGVIEVDGEDWQGLGRYGQMSELPGGFNDAAGNVTFTLSGVDAEIVRLARSEQSKVKGRDVTIYGQFLSAPGVPIYSKYVMGVFTMDTMTFRGSGPRNRSIELVGESIWANRNGAAYANYSDRDQQARFPGDKGLEFIHRMTSGRRVTWPVF